MLAKNSLIALLYGQAWEQSLLTSLWSSPQHFVIHCPCSFQFLVSNLIKQLWWQLYIERQNTIKWMNLWPLLSVLSVAKCLCGLWKKHQTVEDGYVDTFFSLITIAWSKWCLLSVQPRWSFEIRINMVLCVSCDYWTVMPHR